MKTRQIEACNCVTFERVFTRSVVTVMSEPSWNSYTTVASMQLSFPPLLLPGHLSSLALRKNDVTVCYYRQTSDAVATLPYLLDFDFVSSLVKDFVRCSLLVVRRLLLVVFGFELIVSACFSCFHF